MYIRPKTHKKNKTGRNDESSRLKAKKKAALFGFLLSFGFILVGVFLLLQQVLLPVVISYANDDRREPIINPLDSSRLSVKQVQTDTKGFSFEELNDQAEKHLALNSAPEEVDKEPRPEHMYLSIPKLEIKDAIVDVDSTNMDPVDALGHFKGSCLPGDGCNSFIYGHSTFKYFKNQYEEGDYRAIFSRLEELSYGDEFTIRYKDKEYRYIVDFSRVQNPEEVDPLGSPYPMSIGKHESTVELFTCTPSGSTKYRLSVVGKLID